MFSFGVKRYQVRNIFISQGLIIGLTSVVIGSFLGVFLTLVQQHFGLIQIQMTSSILTSYPVSLLLSDLLKVSGIVIFISLLASLFPGIISTKKNNFNNIKNAFV